MNNTDATHAPDGTTPKEKWERLTNPKTAEDYGLSLTETELETFDEGRSILSDLRGIIADDSQTELIKMLGASAADTVERMRHKVITEIALPADS